MKYQISNLAVTALSFSTTLVTALPQFSGHTKPEPATIKEDYYVSLGPRPYYLIDNMTDSSLKQSLKACENGPFQITDFSIGHRGGGTLQFPEETEQSVMAGARMGAGILECDVSFTADRGLVCRHSLCDLHSKSFESQSNSMHVIRSTIKYMRTSESGLRCGMNHSGRIRTLRVRDAFLSLILEDY